MPLLSKVAVAHMTMALVASCFGGMNVILQWALQEQDPTKDTTRDKIGRATVFALYRDVGAAGLLLLMSILFGLSQWRGSAVSWREPKNVLQICACGVLGIGAHSLKLCLSIRALILQRTHIGGLTRHLLL